jgi:pre-60S factor REI1
MRVYYSQNLRHPSSIPSRTDLSTLKVDQVRKRLADPSLALVPVAGGQGAFGRGLEVMKARNAGEAKWARQQARSHLDQRKKEAMKTRVGYVHNNQKRELNDVLLSSNDTDRRVRFPRPIA